MTGFGKDSSIRILKTSLVFILESENELAEAAPPVPWGQLETPADPETGEREQEAAVPETGEREQEIIAQPSNDLPVVGDVKEPQRRMKTTEKKNLLEASVASSSSREATVGPLTVLEPSKNTSSASQLNKNTPSAAQPGGRVVGNYAGDPFFLPLSSSSSSSSEQPNIRKRKLSSESLLVSFYP